MKVSDFIGELLDETEHIMRETPKVIEHNIINGRETLKQLLDGTKGDEQR